MAPRPLEAWLSGPVPGVPPLLVPVAHALLQARADARAAASAPAAGDAAGSRAALWIRPFAAASPGFHLFHAVGAMDRLFTYARGESLSDSQRAYYALEVEGGDPSLDVAALLELLDSSVDRALEQLRALSADELLAPRRVGRAGAPSNVLGLLFHAAEHTTRHVGQFITTSKIASAAAARPAVAREAAFAAKGGETGPLPPGVPAFSTARLDLVLATPAALRAALTDEDALAAALGVVIPETWPHEYLDDAALTFLESRLARHPDEVGWWSHFLVLRGTPPTLIGTAGYKGPPSPDGTVEIGYGIVSDQHRRGYASEAAGALVAAAFRSPAVRRVIAETLPELTGSIGVLMRCGFRLLGDGSEPGVIRYEITRQEFEARERAMSAQERPTAAPSGAAEAGEGGAPAAALSTVNLAAAFSRFDELWSPRIAGELNGQHVKLAKLHGEFVWHHHEREDELFYVVRGRLEMHLRDRVVPIGEGEFFIVPRGVEHKPVAPEEAHILLFEPASTSNTGNVRDERTREHLERL